MGGSKLLLVGVVNLSECGLLVFLRSRYHPQERRPLELNAVFVLSAFVTCTFY